MMKGTETQFEDYHNSLFIEGKLEWKSPMKYKDSSLCICECIFVLLPVTSEIYFHILPFVFQCHTV